MIKNDVSIRHIFFRTHPDHFCHMSRSLLVSSLVCQDTLFLSLIYFFDQMLVCSFWGGGSGLDFFSLFLLTSTGIPTIRNCTLPTPQRSPEGYHGHVPWSMNGVHFATGTYRTGFQKKDQGEDGDSRRKPYLLPKIFGINLRFEQVAPVAGLIFETKNRAIFLERFFGREITAREQLFRAVILARF